MGQHWSKTVVCVNAHAKCKDSRKIKENNNVKYLRNIYSGSGSKKNCIKLAKRVEAKEETLQVPLVSSASNRITTTINVHIEEKGGVSATTTTLTKSIPAANVFDTSCDYSNHCQCASNSPRQLIIKIQLSKMEQTNTEFNTPQFVCCNSYHNKIQQQQQHKENKSAGRSSTLLTSE